MIGVNLNNQYWYLTYYSILDHKRHKYMSIAFDSYEGAEREKTLLEEEYKKRWSQHTDEEIQQMWINGITMYVSMVGRDYKVEPAKFRSL